MYVCVWFTEHSSIKGHMAELKPFQKRADNKPGQYWEEAASAAVRDYEP